MSEKLGVRLVSPENSNVKIGTRENAIIFLRQNRGVSNFLNFILEFQIIFKIFF